MKGFALLIVAVTLHAGTAAAAPGYISAFSDASGTNCQMTDAPDGYIAVYIFHSNTTGAKGSEFKLVVPSGWTHLGDIEPFEATVGTPLEGVSIEYGACRTGSFMIYQCNFLGDGSSPGCSRTVQFVASPNAGSGRVEGIDCSDNVVFPGTWDPIVNGDASCPCTA